MLYIRRVHGDSMSPALRDGQVAVFARRRVIEGDIVLARQASREIVKRVTKAENGLVYLVGDNRSESRDSRHYGPVPKRAILGVIMLALPKAVAAPKLTRPYGVWLGRVAAVILIGMAVIQLFRIDTFIPILAESLGTDSGIATVVALSVIVAEIFAVPFALRMKLSPLGHLVSGMLMWVAPLLWLFISSWSLGFSDNTGQLGEFIAVPAVAWVIVANLAWLFFNHLTLYTLGYNSLRIAKLLRK